MTTVNYINPKIDQSVRIFDQFYDFELLVPADQYDAVNSYFKSVFTDATAAGNFTVTLFRISQLNNIPVLSLLDELKTTSGIELTATLAYYLNAERSGSTLLGVAEPVQPNLYTARNVRQ